MSPAASSGPAGCDPPQGKRLWRGILVACLWIVPVVAVLIGVLLVAVQHTRLDRAGRQFLSSLFYSMLIGIPTAIVLNWIGFRYSERFPRLVVLLNTVALLGTCAFGTLAAALLLQFTGMVGPGQYWNEFASSFPTAIVITLITGLSISSFETMRHRLQTANLVLRTQQMEQERAYKLVAEAKLSSLASRIHPHFLFNTLNSIASLIPSDPKRAEDMVSKLASLLRFSLSGNQSGLVPLAQELKIVRDYLEIERTRFGSRLRYEIDVAAALEAVQVPPLALQSVVENAIKHVVAQRPEGATIKVTGSTEDNRLRLQVIDDGPGFSLESITPEHGLGNLVSRLELLFGDRGQLSVTRRDGTTIVTLMFPIER